MEGPMRYSVILLILGLITTGKVRGEVISISGTVKNRQTNLAVQGALVSLEGTSLSSLTDANGAFTLGKSNWSHNPTP